MLWVGKREYGRENWESELGVGEGIRGSELRIEGKVVKGSKRGVTGTGKKESGLSWG